MNGNRVRELILEFMLQKFSIHFVQANKRHRTSDLIKSWSSSLSKYEKKTKRKLMS